MQNITWKYKFFLLFLFSVVYLILYIFPNLNPLFEPRTLFFFPGETTIPFLPWTFLVYLSDYLLALIVIVVQERKEQMDRFARMAFFSLFICGGFFLLFPTIYPRPEYPAVANPIVQFAMFLVSTADRPTNCFPSMHVTLTSIAAYNTRFLGRKKLSFFIFWSLAIFLSTLTTKQHYIVDILGGIAVSVCVIACEVWLYPRCSVFQFLHFSFLQRWRR